MQRGDVFCVPLAQDDQEEDLVQVSNGYFFGSNFRAGRPKCRR